MKRRQFIGVAALALALAGGATTYAASSTTAVTQAINAQLAAQHGPNNQRGPGGQVTSVNGTTITVTNPRGTETIATTSATTFVVDGAASTLAAIKAGLYIHAEGSKASDGTFTATNVMASTTQPTPPADHGPGRGPGGQVTSVNGTTITMTNPRGTETIATTSSTTFKLDGVASSLSAMKAGLYIHAEGSKASDGTFTATNVMASTTQPTPPADHGPGRGPGGQIASVSGTTITVTNPRGTETIATTSSTTFKLDGVASSLSAMKAGLYIHAEGSKASDGTFTATNVMASTTQPTRPQAGERPGR